MVLGAGGRLAMAALAIANRKRPEFSWGGSLDVVILGTFYGAVGGVLLALLRRAWPQGKHWRGIGWGESPGCRVGEFHRRPQTAAVAPVSVLTVLAISLVVFVVYGVVADTWRTLATREAIAAIRLCTSTFSTLQR